VLSTLVRVFLVTLVLSVVLSVTGTPLRRTVPIESGPARSVVDEVLGCADVELELHVARGLSFSLAWNVGNADDLERSHGDDE